MNEHKPPGDAIADTPRKGCSRQTYCRYFRDKLTVAISATNLLSRNMPSGTRRTRSRSASGTYYELTVIPKQFRIVQFAQETHVVRQLVKASIFDEAKVSYE